MQCTCVTSFKNVFVMQIRNKCTVTRIALFTVGRFKLLRKKAQLTAQMGIELSLWQCIRMLLS